MQGRETCDELVVGDDAVLVLVQALEEKAEALLARVQIGGLEELMNVVARHVPLILSVDITEGCIQFDRCFINDSLAD